MSGAKQAGVENVEGIDRFGIGEDVCEVPRALAHASILVDATPVFASVVGTVQPAFLGLDQSVHTVGVCARDRDANSSHNARGQAVAFQMSPGAAAVDRFVQPTSR